MNEAMSLERFYTIPRFEQISFLVHGFGTKYLAEKQLPLVPGTEKFALVFLDQVHSDVIHIIDTHPRHRLKGDALLCDQAGFLLVVKTADCLPVLIVDEFKKIIAVVHCGWKGTSQGLVKKVVQRMVSLFECDAASLLAGLGPCVECDCYEVGEDVRERFMRNGHSMESFDEHPHLTGKYLLDLREANRRQLIQAGAIAENIFSIDDCTYCHDDLFSFRQEREKAGRMFNFIGMLAG